MHDILDSLISPIRLGSITTDPRNLAQKACRAIQGFRTHATLFVDPANNVYAQPAAYANGHPVDEIIGIYGTSVQARDLAEDFRATAAARLKAIGMLES